MQSALSVLVVAPRRPVLFRHSSSTTSVLASWSGHPEQVIMGTAAKLYVSRNVPSAHVT